MKQLAKERYHELAKWALFGKLEDVSIHLNRIFGRSLARPDTGQEVPVMAGWTPSADICETKTACLINAEIAGLKEEDVTLNKSAKTKAINVSVT